MAKTTIIIITIKHSPILGRDTLERAVKLESIEEQQIQMNGNLARFSRWHGSRLWGGVVVISSTDGRADAELFFMGKSQNNKSRLNQKLRGTKNLP